MRKHHRTKRRAVTAAVTLALLTVGAGGTATAADGPDLVNPDFEAGLTGWNVTGDQDAAFTEPGGQDGGARLTHWSDAPFEVTTSQRVTGLARGWWTLSAWVRAGGGLDATTLALTGCGLDQSTAVPLTEQDDQWVRLTLTGRVTRGSSTVELTTTGPAGAWASLDAVELTPGRTPAGYRGGDLSGLAKNEDHGAEYFSADGTRDDAVEILAEAGMNLGRLRVWVDPADGYNEVTHVVESARRIVDAGMELLVDFHYSDRWADPGAQHVPAAWAGHGPDQLAQDVYDHTREVLDALAAEGITADMVQIGNEINPGMLHPWGQTWDVDPADEVDGAQWDNLAAFLTAGARAVKDVATETDVVLHLTNINHGIGSLTWWFDEVVARDVPFDLIGLSYYGYWHGSFADLQEAISTLSGRYERDVLVVETAYPFTLEDDEPSWENIIDLESELVAGYPATPEGQAAWLRAVRDVVAGAPGGHGLGIVYWEPAWTAVPGAGWDPGDPASGNAWENQALFGFDGRALPALRELHPDPPRPSHAG